MISKFFVTAIGITALVLVGNLFGPVVAIIVGLTLSLVGVVFVLGLVATGVNND